MNKTHVVALLVLIGTRFSFAQVPTITSFSPTSGTVGTSVSITGTNFSTTLSDNIVYFGAVRATVTSATSTSLTVTVPMAATYDPISATVNGLTAYSIAPFVVTFPSSGGIDASSFASRVNFATGATPYVVRIGDLDGDGKPDIAVSNIDGNTISILRNTGDAGTVSFASKVDFATGVQPFGVAIGDLDGDGKLDIAVSNYGSNTISIFRNTGIAGTVSFASKVDFATGVNPEVVAIGDLDGDGKPDIAVSNFGSNTVSILRNTGVVGTVSFASKVDFATGIFPFGVAIGDLDGDGKPDIAVANVGSNTVSILRNTGVAGTVSFASKVDFATGTNPYGVAIGDLNGDGKPDIALSNEGSNTVSIFRNTGVAGTVSFAVKVDFTTGSGPWGVAIGDLDGDGKPDIAVSNQSSSTVSLFRNTEAAGTVSFAPKVDFATAGNPLGVAIGDLDGDGKPDITTANGGGSPTVSVLRNIVPPPPPPPVITSFAPLSGPIGTSLTITGNNFSDTTANNIVYLGAVRATVTAATATSLTVTVPTGTTYAPITVTVNGLKGYSLLRFVVTFADGGSITSSSFAPKIDFSTGTYPRDVAIGDLDADGKPDLALPNYIGPPTYYAVSVFRNVSTSGSVNFASKVDFETGSDPWAVTIGDFDGDGKLDLAVINYGSRTVSILRNTSTIGSISFASKVDFATYPSVGNPWSLDVGDFDGDGKSDLAVVNATANIVSVFRNTGTPGSISFASRLDFGTVDAALGVAIGDLDGDGKVDLMVANAGSSAGTSPVSIFRNTSTSGSISFATRMDIAMPTNNTRNVAIGDLDGDGKLDLAAGTAIYLSVFRNTSVSGSISFASRIDYYLPGSYPNDVAIGDLDGDGKPDIAYSTGVSTFRNTGASGSISFASYVNFSGPSNKIAIGDLDGDGKPELVGESSDTTISVLLNTVNGPPATPQNATATAGNAQVTLRWNANTDPDFLRYRVYGSTSPNPTTQIDSTTGGIMDTSKTISSLTNGTTYYFRVTAVDSAGNESGYSNEVSATPQDTTAPAAPTNLAATAGNAQVGLAWSPNTEPDFLRYRIYGGTTANPTTKIDSTTGGISDTTKTITGLSNGTTYYFRITAIDSSGNESGYSNEVSATPFIPPPTISSFTPISGPIGTSVTIIGSNFDPTEPNNIVHFGAVRGTVVSSSATSITVTVPTGATFAPITVTTNGLTARSRLPFTVTFVRSRIIDSTSLAPQVNFSLGGGDYWEVKGADFDVDGKLDIALAGFSFNSSITRNTSSAQTVSFAASVDLLSNAYGLAVGDLDGDGKHDLILPQFGSAMISVFRNTSTVGAISFASKVDFSTGTLPHSCEIADVDGDGKPDLVVTSGSATVSILRSTSSVSSISFESRVDFNSVTTSYGVAVGDIDGDGKADIAVTNFSGNSFSVFRNMSTIGSISLASRLDFTCGASPYGIALADLDGDSKLDAVIADGSDNTISVLKNTSTAGAISFDSRSTLSAGTTPYFVNVGDINGDGKPDIALTNQSDGTLSLLINTSDTTGIFFETRKNFGTVGSANGLMIGGANGDARPDIMVASGNILSVFRNTIPLSEPQNLIATAGNAQVALRWSQNTEPDFLRYRIYGGTTSTPTTQIDSTQAGNASDTSITIYQLTNNQIYYFRISAVDSAGNESAYSNEVNATPIGLMAYYPFNGNANDESGSGRHGTVNGGATLTTDRFGQPNSAYAFDGLDDYVGTGISMLNGLTEFTLAGWIHPTITNDRIGFWGQNDMVEFGYLSSHVVNAWSNPNAFGPSLFDSTLVGGWHFVVAVGYDDSLALFIDGIKRETAAKAITDYGSSIYPFNIGGGGIFDPTGNWFTGSLDDISVYNLALDETSIDSLYRIGGWPPPDVPQILSAAPGNEQVRLTWTSNTDPNFLRYRIYMAQTPSPTTQVDSTTGGIADTTITITQLTNNQLYYFRVTAVDSAGNESGYSNEVSASPSVPLLGEYTPDVNTVLLLHMNETSGSTVSDGSNYGNNGTAGTGVTIESARFGNGKGITQATHSIVVPHDSSLDVGTGGLTVELWINVQQTGTTLVRLLQKIQTSPAYRGWMLGMVDGTFFPLLHAYTGSTTSPEYTEIRGSRSIADGKWHHIAAALTTAEIAMYVDGVFEVRSLISPQGTTDNSADIEFNNSSFELTGDWSGVYDEVRISTIVRSPNEFNLQLPPVNLTAAPSGTTINLSWQNGGGAVPLMRYKVYRGSDSTNVTLIDSTTNSSFSQSDLGPGLYFYRVSAVDSTDFEGEKSYSANATIMGDDPPVPPQDATALAGNGQVILCWNKNTEPDFLRYRIYGSTSPSPTTQIDSTTGGITDTCKTITGLTNGSTYYFRITAVDSAGNESAFSNEVTVTPSLLTTQYEYNPDTNTILLLHMNETSGSSVADASEHTNDGTANGTTIVDGRFGKARSYNGSTDYLSVADAPTLNPTTAVTVEAWVRTTSTADGSVASKYNHQNENTDDAYHLNVGAGAPGRVRWQVATSTNSSILDEPVSVADDLWHHIAGVYTGSLMRIYIDGMVQAQTAFSGPLNQTSFPLLIGATHILGNSGTFFNGLIDEVRISNIARSPSEFNLQLPPVNLVATPSGTTIDLGWQNGGGAAPLMRYKIYRGADSTSLSLIDSVTSTSYPDISLSTGTYFYRVSAVDSTGFEGAQSYGASAAVVAPPTITDFSPKSGPIGTIVTITGTNFSTTAANNIVYFGAVRSGVASATSSSLSVAVQAGATYQPITVTVNGLIAYSQSPFIVTFLGGGSITTGSFAAKVDFTTGAAPQSVGIGDVDGDGKPDVVVTNYPGTVSVFRNISTSGSITAGSFASNIDFTTGGNPVSVAIADVDGDGKTDLVVANYDSGTVSVFRNTSTSGSITASSFAAKVDFTVGAGPRGVAIGDIDGDGKPDLVIPNYNSGTVSVLRNTSSTGSITVSSFASKVDFTTGNNPTAVAIGDLDGDGRADLAVTDFGTAVSVLRNTSTVGSITSSSFAQKVGFMLGVGPIAVAIGDLDGDGKPDIAAPNLNSNTISVLRNISTSGSITASSFAAKVDFTTGTNPRSVAIGDVDGDGKPDLVVTNASSNTVSVFRNTSTSGSITASSFAAKVDFTTGTEPYGVAIGDLDGDGKPELAVANYSGTVSVFRKTVAPATLLGEYQPDANTVLLLHMNEISGTRLNDASAFGNNGTPSGGTTIVDGRFGQALNFDGTGAVAIPAFESLTFGSSDFSAELWVKTTSTVATQRLLFRGTGTNKLWSLDLGFAGPTGVPCFVLQGAQAEVDVVARTRVNDGKWHHIAAVRQDGIAKIYVDGVLERSVDATTVGPTDTLSGGLYMSSGFAVIATLDEVRISNIARSPNEFNLQLPPVNLVATPSGTTINLSWQNGGGTVPLMRYKIYRGADSTNVSLIDSTATLSYQDNSLAVGTYYYRVSAVDSTGFEGARSYAASAVAQQALHVSSSGNDANDGSASSPLRNIQTALDRAVSGTTVKVSSGTYAENLILKAPVSLFGGYNTTFLDSERNLFSNKTILKPSSGAVLSDTTSSAIDGFSFDGSAGANKAIIVSSGHSTVTHNVIHGFFGSGGVGIQVTSSASAVLKNNTITNNKLSGGGVIFYGFYIQGNANGLTVLQNNIAYNNNVGIYVSPSGVDADYNCSFANTFQNYDGANGSPGPNDVLQDPRLLRPSTGDVRLKASSPCIDAGNPADPVGDEPEPNGNRIDLGAYGGTNIATSAAANLSIHVSTIGNNSNSGTADSPVRTIQYALDNLLGDTVKVATGTYGEGLVVPSKTILLGGYNDSFTERNILNNKTVIQAVGAVMLNDAVASTIDGFVFDGRGVPTDAGIKVSNGSLVSHNIVRGVTASFAAGIEVNGGASVINNTVMKCSYGIQFRSGTGAPVVKNNIVAYNSFGMVQDAFTASVRTYNDVFANSFNYTGFDTDPGTGDISLDPQFVDTALTTLDLRILATSPCVDAGDPADLVGDEPAPGNTRIDMGTYGGTAYTPAPSPPSAPSNLTATAVSSSQINLSWTDNSTNEDGFRIERKTGVGGTYGVIATVGSDVSTYQSTGLSASTTYFYRVRAYNTVSNSSYSNEDSATTQSGEGGDVTAPTSPLSASISPSAWSTSPSFTLSWTNPSDASAITGVWYRIGSPPNTSNPGTSIAITSPTATITVSSQGQNAIYFYLEDAAGNKDPNTAVSVVAKFDNTRPTVSHDSLSVPSFNTSSPNDIPVTASSNDAVSGLVSTRLQYRISGTSWTNAASVDYPGSQGGTAAIASSYLLTNARFGVDYRIAATDSAGNIAYSPTHSVAIQVSTDLARTDAQGNQIQQPGTSSLPSGAPPEYAYRMFSVPLDLTDKTPQTIFQTKTGLGPVDPKVWRLYRLSASDTYEEYSAFSSQPVVTPGASFFLILKNPTVITAGSGNIIKAEEMNKTGLPLKSGYNAVGNPFGFDVPTDSLKLADGQTLTNKMWELVGVGGTNGAWRPNPTVLKAWEGIIINLGSGSGTTLKFAIADRSVAAVTTPPLLKVETAPGEGNPSSDWDVRINVRRTDNGIADIENIFGVRESASHHPDEIDLVEPPLFGDHSVALFSKNGDVRLTHDLRAKGEEGYVWDVKLWTPDHDAPVEMTFSGVENLPSEAYLVDIDTKMAARINPQTVLMVRGSGIRNYRLIVGTKEFAEAHSFGIDIIPKAYALYQNYPNPFNPWTVFRYQLPRESDVTLKVYNLLGEEVAVLVHRIEAEGYYEVEWAPRVASGVYFCRLEAVATGEDERFVQTRKMILTK